jgi:hypothetical protein
LETMVEDATESYEFDNHYPPYVRNEDTDDD